jgi:hypothetical protein
VNKRRLLELDHLEVGSAEYQREWKKLDRPSPSRLIHAQREKLRRVLNNVKQRCTNPKATRYEYYGGRGVKNLLTLEDMAFLWDRDGAAQMKQPSIDRKNVDGHYIRENCQFIEFVKNVQKRWHDRKPPTSQLTGYQPLSVILSSSKWISPALRPISEVETIRE